MPTNCWNTESSNPAQTIPAILPSGVFRSCQDGSVSRSIVSRIRWIVASMLARVPPSSLVRISLASSVLCLAMRKRGDSGMVKERTP
jgi:hypothetical protein